MKFAKLAIAAALATAAVSGTAYAQEVTTGATVYGPNGNVVGTVESVTNGVVTVDTGAHKAPLPTSVSLYPMASEVYKEELAEVEALLRLIARFDLLLSGKVVEQ